MAKPPVSIIPPDARAFSSALQEFAAAADKEVGAETQNQAKLLIQGSRETPGLLDITPPSGGGVRGTAARKKGEAAIAGDLFGGREVDMGGFRVETDGLFIVSNVDPHEAAGGYLAEFQSQKTKPKFRKKEVGEDDIVSLFTTKKGKVYGVERQLFRPNATVGEMLDHVAQYRSKATGRISRAGLRDKTIGRHVFIDKMVISPASKKRLLTVLFGRVGSLAGGLLPAALKLKVKNIPAWIRRHAGRAASYGSISITTRKGGASVEIAMDPKYGEGPGARGLHRKFQSALNLREAAMRRQIPHLLAKTQKRAKL